MVASAQTEWPKKLELHEIERDTATQSRIAIDSKKVEEYGERWVDGSLPPPIIVFYDGKHYWLADGWHRIAAAEWAGKKSIECLIREGSKEDAIVHACSANAKHGVPMNDADKRKCIETMLRLRPDWTNTVIGDHVGVCESYVRKVEKQVRTSANLANGGGESLAEQFEKRIGRDGKSYPAKRVRRPGGAAQQVAKAAPSDDELDSMVDDLDEPGDLDAQWIAELQQPYRDAANYLTQAKKKMSPLKADTQDHLPFAKDWQRFEEWLDRTRYKVTGNMPVMVCPFCEVHRQGCFSCHGMGYLTDHDAKQREVHPNRKPVG